MPPANRLSFIALIFGLILLGGCSSGDDSASGINQPLVANAAISDMNGDGAPDIVIENLITTDFRPWSFGINSGGQFEANESLTQTFDPRQIDPLVGVSGGAYENAKTIGVADANHDGKNDILVQLDASDGRVYWKVFVSDGTSSAQTISADGALLSGAGGNDQRAVAFTDIDGDGHADILMRDQSAGYTHLFMYMGNGSFFDENPVPIYKFPTQTSEAGPDEIAGELEILAVEDINNDGTTDIIVDIKKRNSDGGREHCYLVRTYQFGAFEPQPLVNDCAIYIDLDYVGVADLTGDGQSELILMQSEPVLRDRSTRIPLINSVHITEGENGTKWSPDVSRISENTWSDAFGSPINLCENDCDPRFTYTPIVLTDLNNDGRPDLLIEIEFHDNIRATFADPPYTGKRVKAIIADKDGNYELQTWLTNVGKEDEILGVRDYDGDGHPDLLINSPSINLDRDYDGDGVAAELDPNEIATFDVTTRTKLYVLINDSTGFESSGWSLWYENADPVRVTGVEESGLTTLARHTDALISWAGAANSPRYTPNEFKQFLAEKDLDLIDTEQPLSDNQCQIVYASADSQDLSANIGSLVCHIVDVESAVTSILTQQVYGGCDRYDTTVSGTTLRPGLKCQIGIFEENIPIDLPGPVDYNLGIKGPSAGACGAVTVEYTCAEIGADFGSASGGYSLGNSGYNAGIGLGVGVGGGAGLEDGVLSGSVNLKLGIGVKIDFQIDFNEAGPYVVDAGDFVVKHGEEAFVYVGTEVLSAGSGVIDGLTDSGEYVISGVGEGVEVVGDVATTIGDTVSDAGDAIVDFFGDIGGWF